MDIRCPICREPWDMDSLHEQIAEENPDLEEQMDLHGRPGSRDRQKFYEETFYNPMRERFRREGCRAFGCSHNEAGIAGEANQIVREIYDLMGDDIDGAASMLEDAEQMGLFK